MLKSLNMKSHLNQQTNIIMNPNINKNENKRWTKAEFAQLWIELNREGGQTKAEIAEKLNRPVATLGIKRTELVKAVGEGAQADSAIEALGDKLEVAGVPQKFKVIRTGGGKRGKTDVAGDFLSALTSDDVDVDALCAGSCSDSDEDEVATHDEAEETL